MADTVKNRVVVFGTFDIVHPGHMSFLRQAKSFGNELIVVIARDETVNKVKGRKTVFSEIERLKKIKGLPYVDNAVLGSLKDKYSIIKRLDPDIIALGYDQKFFIDNLKEELTKRNVNAKIVRLKPYKKKLYKSSILRKI